MKYNHSTSENLALLVILLLIASINTAWAGKLDASDVTTLVSGNTVVFEHAEGGRVQTRFYNANGTFRQLNKKGNKILKGKWSVNDKGQLCHQRKGKGACHIIYNRGSYWETYVEAHNPTAGNKHILTIKEVLPGNPDNL